MDFRLIHIPKTGGTSLRISGIYGEHGIGYDDSKVNIVLVRNPLDRTLSHYCESNVKNLSFIDWFSDCYYNYQVNYLFNVFNISCLDSLKSFIIKNKIIIIPTDELSSIMKLFGYSIPCVNTKKRNYIFSKNEVIIVNRHSDLDYKLYYWVKNNHKSINKSYYRIGNRNV